MKKIKLKALQLGANDVLTREQLKMITGGDGAGHCKYVCVADVGEGEMHSWEWNSSISCSKTEDCPQIECDPVYGPIILWSKICKF